MRLLSHMSKIKKFNRINIDLTARYSHACGGYYNEQDNFVLLVAGGLTPDYPHGRIEVLLESQRFTVLNKSRGVPVL